MTLLLYGAYGYTGELVAREATNRGIDLVVAGRDERKTTRLADRLGCEARAFALEESAETAAPSAIDTAAADVAETGTVADSIGTVSDHVEDVDAVLNCAGPFVDTYRPLVEACLRTETHYLDVTGELPVFEAIASRDREATAADVCLLPGVGFDVVPTDCLAGHLHERLPSATGLRLGFDQPGSVSRGTLATAIEQFDAGGKVRRDGELVDVPVGHESRRIDFGRGERNAVLVPMGDLSTAHHSTGIGDVEVYLSMPKAAETALQVGRFAKPIVGVEAVKRRLQRLVRATVTGPSKRQREEGACYVWGEATDGDRTVTSRLKTPETYAFTVDAATTAAERIHDAETGHAGEQPPTGYQTPSSAFAPEFVLDLDRVEGFFDA